MNSSLGPHFIESFSNVKEYPSNFVTLSLGLKKKNIRLENTLSKIVKYCKNSSFSFKVINKEEVKNAIKDLPINKSTIYGDIPIKILKQYAQIYSKKLADIFNHRWANFLIL